MFAGLNLPSEDLSDYRQYGFSTSFCASISYLYNLSKKAVYGTRLWSVDKLKGNARTIFRESLPFVLEKGVNQIYQRALPTAPIIEEYKKNGFMQMEQSEIDRFYRDIFPQIERRDDGIHMCKELAPRR